MKLSSGQVTYGTPPEYAVPEGEALLCTAVPAAGSGPVVLDILPHKGPSRSVVRSIGRSVGISYYESEHHP